jgi:hypothetical protein
MERFLRFVRLRRRRDDLIPWALPPDLPPDIGVREPRRPRPSLSGGAVTLELPPDLD